MKTMIAVDVGTTHVKSILFAEDGEILREEKAETPFAAGSGNGYLPEQIWGIVRQQLLTLAADETPVGISITGMAEAGLVINRESGRAESEIIPWFDRRTVELAKQVSEAEDDENFRTTGLRSSFKFGIYKFLWLIDHRGIKKENAVWLSMCDYIAYRLTGRFVTDPSFAARTYVYDVIQGCWDEKRMQSYGVEPANFPEVLPSGEAAGIWEEKGIPVAVAGHDHICAAFGLLYHNPNEICNSTGTSETYVGRLEQLGGGFQKESGLLYGPFVDGGWFYMANIPSSGHSVEWFRKTVQAEAFSYDTMNENLEQLPQGPTDILYFPYLTGMGSPYYDANMRGALIGLREDHDCYTILKGIIEGVQYQAAYLLSILKEKHGIAVNSIICAGGSVKNRTLLQIKADVLNTRIEVPAITEATLLGAAALFLKRQEGKAAAEKFLQNPLLVTRYSRPDETIQKKYHEIWKHRFVPFIEILRHQSKE